MLEEFDNNLSKKIEPDTKGQKEKNSFWDLARFALIAVIIVLPIRIFIAQPFIVSGASMYPTFHDGEYLIIDEISYLTGKPERNDVVVFRYPKDPKKFFIKRIIGLPSETIDIKNGKITIKNEEFKEGMILEEPYIEDYSGPNVHYELGEKEYFVMGDNRNASSDSRYWGPVKENLLIGKAFLRLLPISKLELMPGKYKE